jgi:hypothetical protein
MKIAIMTKDMAKAREALSWYRARSARFHESSPEVTSAISHWRDVAMPRIDTVNAALAAVNGRAESFTIHHWGDVERYASRAEALLGERGVTKRNRVGTVLTVRPAGPTANRYKYAAITTRLELTRTSGGWFITSIERDSVQPTNVETFALSISEEAGRDVTRKALAGIRIRETVTATTAEMFCDNHADSRGWDTCTVGQEETCQRYDNLEGT